MSYNNVTSIISNKREYPSISCPIFNRQNPKFCRNWTLYKVFSFSFLMSTTTLPFPTTFIYFMLLTCNFFFGLSSSSLNIYKSPVIWFEKKSYEPYIIWLRVCMDSSPPFFFAKFIIFLPINKWLAFICLYLWQWWHWTTFFCFLDH